jgi:hypothetical protein
MCLAKADQRLLLSFQPRVLSVPETCISHVEVSRTLNVNALLSPPENPLSLLSTKDWRFFQTAFQHLSPLRKESDNLLKCVKCSLSRCVLRPLHPRHSTPEWHPASGGPVRGLGPRKFCGFEAKRCCPCAHAGRCSVGPRAAAPCRRCGHITLRAGVCRRLSADARSQHAYQALPAGAKPGRVLSDPLSVSNGARVHPLAPRPGSGRGPGGRRAPPECQEGGVAAAS